MERGKRRYWVRCPRYRKTGPTLDSHPPLSDFLRENDKKVGNFPRVSGTICTKRTDPRDPRPQPRIRYEHRPLVEPVIGEFHLYVYSCPLWSHKCIYHSRNHSSVSKSPSPLFSFQSVICEEGTDQDQITGAQGK